MCGAWEVVSFRKAGPLSSLFCLNIRCLDCSGDSFLPSIERKREWEDRDSVVLTSLTFVRVAFMLRNYLPSLSLLFDLTYSHFLLFNVLLNIYVHFLWIALNSEASLVSVTLLSFPVNILEYFTLLGPLSLQD